MSCTPEQLQQYHRDGYLVVPGLLTDAEIDAFVAYEAAPKPEGWRQNLRHHVDDARWAALARHPAITRIAGQILGARPMTVQTMYMEKRPAGDHSTGGRGVALHQDLHYLPCEPPRLMACWVALTDADAENGGLCVVPGSHTRGLRPTRKNRNADEHDAWETTHLMRDRSGRTWHETLYSFEIEGLRRDEVVHLSVPSGGGVFFDGLTIHGSYANRSRQRVRRAFAVHYVAEGSWLFRADVQAVIPAT